MAFVMKAGDTKRLNITLRDKKTGQPYDLTFAQIRWWASRGDTEKFSRTPAIQKSLGNGIEEISALDGQCLVTIQPADTRELAGVYYHEVEITDAYGNVATPIAETFTIEKDLIR